MDGNESVDPDVGVLRVPGPYTISQVLDDVAYFRIAYGIAAKNQMTCRLGVVLSDHPEHIDQLHTGLGIFLEARRVEPIARRATFHIVEHIHQSLPTMAHGARLAIRAEQIAARVSAIEMKRFTLELSTLQSQVGTRNAEAVVSAGNADTVWTLRRLARLQMIAASDVSERLSWWWSVAVGKYLLRVPEAMVLIHLEALEESLHQLLPAENAIHVYKQVSAQYRRIFEVSKTRSNRRTAVEGFVADATERCALLAARAPAQTGERPALDRAIEEVAPESLSAVAEGLVAHWESYADEESVWAQRQASIATAVQKYGAADVDTSWRDWIHRIWSSLAPLSAARWTGFLLRGAQFAGQIALASELLVLSQQRFDRLSIRVALTLNRQEIRLVTPGKLAELLRRFAACLVQQPLSLAALPLGIVTFEWMTPDASLSGSGWRRIWLAIEQEFLVTLQPSAAMAMRRLTTQMLSMADGIEDGAKLFTWLSAERDPIFSEQSILETSWRETLSAMIVGAITPGAAPVPGASIVQRLSLISHVLNAQTPASWPEAWVGIEAVVGERISTRLRPRFATLSTQLLSALHARAKVGQTPSLRLSERYRLLLPDVPGAESSCRLEALALQDHRNLNSARDENVLLGLPSTSPSSPEDAALWISQIEHAAVAAAPVWGPKRMVFFGKREPLPNSDARTFLLCLRLSAMTGVMGDPEVRAHLQESVFLGFSSADIPGRLSLLLRLSRDVMQAGDTKLTQTGEWQNLLQHVNGLEQALKLEQAISADAGGHKSAPFTAKQEARLALIRQLTISLRGQAGGFPLRAAAEFIAKHKVLKDVHGAPFRLLGVAEDTPSPPTDSSPPELEHPLSMWMGFTLNPIRRGAVAPPALIA